MVSANTVKRTAIVWLLAVSVWLLRTSDAFPKHHDAVDRMSQIIKAYSAKESVGRTPKETSKFTPKETVERLAKELQDIQVKKHSPYVLPGIWEKEKGLYPSEVKVNFNGGPLLTNIRDVTSVFDNNMFATVWITIAILESYYYTREPRPTNEQINLALEAIAQYHDRNRAYTNSVMNFWPQVYNKSTATWESTPSNLLSVYGIFDVIPAKLIEEILTLLGMTDVEKFIEMIISMR